MALVLDASVAASWAFPDEGQPQAALALGAMRHDEALVPSLWWFEVWNVLVVSERRRRIVEADTRAFLHALSRLAVTVDHSPDETALLALARRHQLSAYDAAYLELAQRRGLPLATLDAALAVAARAEHVALIGEDPA
jgi:predicted nucleic acid-binding protein